MRVEAGTLIWSFFAHVAFGLTNFLIGCMNGLPIDNWASVGVLWFSAGLTGLVGALYFLPTEGSVFFANPSPLHTQALPPLISVTVKLVVIAGGVCIGFSQMMMKASFGMAPQLSGPLCAVISSDVIVVSTFCHFMYGEKMNTRQAVGVGAVVVGLAIMALFSSADDSEAVSGSSGSSIIAFVYSVIGMFSFAFAVLAIRDGSIAGLAAWSGFIVRMLTLLVLGVLAFAYSVYTVKVAVGSVFDWAIPVSAGLVQAVGVLCVNKALQFPNTGVANAIFASNSVDVLILNALIFGLTPSVGAFVGMCVVMCAVASISLLEGKATTVDMETSMPPPLQVPLIQSE